MTTSTSITSGQEKQFKRFVEDAADCAFQEVATDKDDLQRLIERGDEFSATVLMNLRSIDKPTVLIDQQGQRFGYGRTKTAFFETVTVPATSRTK